MPCAKRINSKGKYPIPSVKREKSTPKYNEQGFSNLWENIKVNSILRNRLPEVKEQGRGRKRQDKIIRSL